MSNVPQAHPSHEICHTTTPKNALTHALTTAGDFIPAEEREEFVAFTARYLSDLNPRGIAEESCALEVRSAAWRLRRCRALEAALPLYPASEAEAEHHEKTIKSIERARAHAHNITRKAMLELRRLQAEPQTPIHALEPPVTPEPAAHPFCKNENPGLQIIPTPRQIPRGGLCPCKSGKKYKRCCGKDAPPLLHRGAKKAA